MKQFECINTFQTSKGVRYEKRDQIYESEYYSLITSERQNFKEVMSDMAEFTTPPSKSGRKYDEDGNPRDRILNTPQEEDSPKRGYVSLPDDTFEEDDMGFDFGGGDTGGGGASDDY